MHVLNKWTNTVNTIFFTYSMLNIQILDTLHAHSHTRMHHFISPAYKAASDRVQAPSVVQN